MLKRASDRHILRQFSSDSSARGGRGDASPSAATASPTQELPVLRGNGSSALRSDNGEAGASSPRGVAPTRERDDDEVSVTL
mmetsp:Transcript_14217/g.35976  ORF Transcript_14217/g.35976 Transcript_14217/m.35976 type:complete len:82 (+) Transcript_14217:1-246(+)